MYKKLLLTISGILVTLIFSLVTTGYIQSSFLQLLEYVSYDARVQLTSSGDQDPRVVIVDIDERSLVEEGRWPWRRDKIAQLVDELVNTYHAEVVVFDMVFAEKERNFSIDQLIELATDQGKKEFISDIRSFEPFLDRDAIFAQSISASGRVVLGYYFYHQSENDVSNAGSLPAPLFASNTELNRTTYAVQATGFAGNIDVLQQGSLSAGFFSNPVVDQDGIYRRVPVLVEYKGAMYPSLALSAVQSYIGIDAEPLLAPGTSTDSDYPALEALDLAGSHIPLDANAVALVPYQGPEGTFAYVSATDVLHRKLSDPEQLAGTIALIGTTAAGLADLRSTPVQNVYPGVEVHANLIVGMMDGIIKQQPAYTIAVELLMVVIAGLFLSFFLPRVSPLYGGILMIVTIGMITAINLFAWNTYHHVLPFAAPLSVIVLIYAINTIYGFFFEARSRSQLGSLFGQYIPPELVDKMSVDPGRYTLEGEKRELTVLFSDVRNFTTISEAMEPRELTRMMNSFLTPLTRAVHENRGTIDKYMGDALMAFWGAPVTNENHASDAVATALRMIRQIEELQGTFKQEGWQEIRVGIGINTGEMSVGNMGSEFRVAYTVMGDAVNLGSRIEGLTKRYGVSIIVSEYTIRAAPDYAYVELDLVRVKGKTQPVAIYTPIGLVENLSAREIEFIQQHQRVIEQYRRQSFDVCLDAFTNERPLEIFEPLYELYAQRIRLFLQTPPPENWDGVFLLTEKR